MNNCEKYGGDRSRVFLMGQSAGAHLSSVALLEQAKRERLVAGAGHTHTLTFRPGRMMGGIREEEEDDEDDDDSSWTGSFDSAIANPRSEVCRTVRASISESAPEVTNANADVSVDEKDGAKKLEWVPSDLAGYVGISGPYNLPGLREYWESKVRGKVLFILGSQCKISFLSLWLASSLPTPSPKSLINFEGGI